jgi:mRNA-degrading endonuclease toxin of MazEF toxin-antitoxin module
VEERSVTAPSQGDVLISNPSPLTGERELYTVVSADVYNAAGGPTVLIAEIETGTRYRASAYATETDYGVVLADRVVWLPVDMLGEPFGRLTDTQRDRVVNQIIAVLRGH